MRALRCTHGAEERAGPGNSPLVAFELPPRKGTLLRFRETGSREMGWPTAMLQEQYDDHANGWDHFPPRTGSCADALAGRSPDRDRQGRTVSERHPHRLPGLTLRSCWGTHSPLRRGLTGSR